MSFVDWSDQDFLFPSLFIGTATWPPTLDDIGYYIDKDTDSVNRLRSLDLHKAIILTPHQTAGVCCNQLRLMGVFFKLPKDNPLVQIAVEKSTDVGTPPAWQDLVEWEQALKQLNFSMRGIWYHLFQEAFAVLDPEEAFEYAVKNAEGIWTADRELLPPSLFQSLDDVKDVLKESWLSIYNEFATTKRKGPVILIPGIHLHGAIVYENSD